MEIKKIKIDQLKPAKYNPRIDLKEDDKEFVKIMDSIKRFGLVEPIVVNGEDMTVIGGHQRLKAAKILGHTEIECALLFGLSKNDEKILNVSLNKLSGKWDYEKLEELINSIDIDQVKFTGFDQSELNDLFGILDETLKAEEEKSLEEEKKTEEEKKSFEEKEEQSKPDETIEKKCSYGDIWELGGHRLFCINILNCKSLISNIKFDLLHADPPYGMHKKIKNDNLSFDDMVEFNKKWFEVGYKMMGNTSSFYIWGKNQMLMDFYSFILRPLVLDKKIIFRNLIVWDKLFARGMNSSYQKMFAPADELLLFCMKKTEHAYFNNIHDKMTNIWGYDTTRRKEEDSILTANHPTPKPLFIMERIIKTSCPPNGTVLDFFGGSGSTLIACEQLERVCYCVEFEPKFCDIIINRWEKVTGKKARKIDRYGESLPLNIGGGDNEG